MKAKVTPMKKLISIIAMLLCVAMLAACGTTAPAATGDASPESTGSTDGEARDNVLVTLNVEPTALHAGFATGVVDSLVSNQFYDPLIVRKNGEYQPHLAKSWAYSDDNLDITFELRDDVYFHNGEKLTAEDVAFSYNTVIKGGYSQAVCGFMDNMEVVDDTHVVLHCNTVYGAALESISQPCMAVFPKAYYEADPDAFVRNPIGSGPYKFVEWKTGASIEMEANEEYWAGAPAIKHATFVIYNNAASSAALALENGELDVLTTVSTTDYNRLRNNGELQFLSTPGSTISFIMFSMEEGGIFNDENLRLAVAHAVDKESVLLGAIEGEGDIANAIFPDYAFGVAGYTAPGYDVEKAKEYLALAGYPDGLDITIVASANEIYYKPAEIVQSQLQEAGINVTLEKMDQNAWFDDVWKKGEYGMSVLTFSCSVADVLYYYEMFHSAGTENYGHVNCPELDEAYDRARVTTDLTERAAAVQDVVRAFGDHAICVPIYSSLKALVANKDLVGITPDAEGIYSIADWSWGE